MNERRGARQTAREAPACEPGPDGTCALCGDEATPGRVLAVDAGTRTAEVAMPGGARHVALDLVDDVAVGDEVLVHQGFAISRVESA